ncbi:hypothetical protein [Actinokineospora enzanensis]|uniref:hypothetical protein n=1 Tax=Actinokineospora enzanensis TaxID=155975 RepID=UPI0003A6CCF6|nr:hypothetical protein [Actinokineospora enzanensis]
MTVVLSACLAAISALAGSVITTVWRARQEAEQAGLGFAREQAKDALAAAVDLLTALDAHRNAMWYLEDAREQGDADGEQRWRGASETTRDAVTGPHLWVRCLIPAVTDAAEKAVRATYDMEGAGALGRLPEAQHNAKNLTVAYERAVITAVHQATIGGTPVALMTRP